MAGSLFDRVYTDDQGQEWGIRIDEDKAGVEGAGFEEVSDADDLQYMPRGMKPRGVNCVKTSGDGAGYIHRFLPCGSPDAELYTGESKTFEWNGDTWEVTSTRGESRRRPRTFNSGLVGESSAVGQDGTGGEGGG